MHSNRSIIRPAVTAWLAAGLLILCGNAWSAEAAGVITLLTGRATAASDDGQIRPLSRDENVFAGEMISTGPASYVNIKFMDGGRVLLRPNSRFSIEQYHYSEKSHQTTAAPAADKQGGTPPQQQESAFFRLLKGGFRAISGLIGKQDHDNYRVRTAVATIGIRGTDYEVRVCDGDCLDVDPVPQDGLYASVNSGGIAITNQAGEHLTLQDQFAFVAGPNIPAVALRAKPPALAQDPIPDPKNCGD